MLLTEKEKKHLNSQLLELDWVTLIDTTENNTSTLITGQ